MTTNLARQYERGAITAHHCAVESLTRLDPAHPELALAALPTRVLREIRDFANGYRPGEMVSNYGDMPTPAQVTAAKAWVEEALAREVIKQ